jgi:hypothetical protein
MQPNDGQLEVEVLLHAALISGFSTSAIGRKRLVDVLNDLEEEIELHEVTLQFLPSGRTSELTSISIKKQSIIVAIPHETAVQGHQRQMSNLGGRTKTRQIAVMIVTPDYSITGIAHALPGGTLGKVITLSPSLFTHFFPMTDAVITAADGTERTAEVALINRDLIAAIASR